MGGYGQVIWYIVTADYKLPFSQNVYFYIENNLKPGDLIFSGPHTYEDASKILRKMA